MNNGGEYPYRLIPSFVSGVAGRLFTLFYQPNNPTHLSHAIVFFPPFAEELNKSRRMITLQAQRFASNGYSVLIADFYGSGDSEGDFYEARLEIWREDVVVLKKWLEKQGVEKFTLWGFRMGALLALDSMPQFTEALQHILLWAPVIKADQAITQFLRLRLVADMIQGDEQRETTKTMREQLAQSQSIEVAGYLLHPDLVTALDRLDLNAFTLNSTIPVDWFEVVSNPDRPQPLPIRKRIDSWQDAGVHIQFHAVPGVPFWNTPEITEVPELVELTTNALVRT